jgi:hypothetical protein
MKIFLKKIVGFSLFLIIVIIAICEIQIPDATVIWLTENTSYEKIAWNVRLINNSHEQLKNSYIFIGPSLVEGAINDSMLNSFGYKSINMGVRHGGADLDYYFVSRIIEHKPGFIFLHRFPKGNGVFHPMMPLLMSPIKYFLNFQNISTKFFFKFIPKRLYFVLKFAICCFIEKKGSNIKKNDTVYGWRSRGNGHIIIDEVKVNCLVSEKVSLNSRIKKEFFNKSGVLVYSSGTLKNIWRFLVSNFVFGNGEDTRIRTISLCENANVNVAEIYIPHFPDACFDSKMESNKYFFRRQGISKPVYYLKNVAFLSNQIYWVDQEHLNAIGSYQFTDSIYKILPK